MMEDDLRQVKGQSTNDDDNVETWISQGNAAKILLSTSCFFAMLVDIRVLPLLFSLVVFLFFFSSVHYCS